MRVLVVGGSGYLGQFLVQELSKHHTVAYTYHTTALTHATVDAEPFSADLATGKGLEEALVAWKPDAVVNCAAVSQPAACERDYEQCASINVPARLTAALQRLQKKHGVRALLVHLSTDQVYDGSRAGWTEACPAQPVNAYGRSKAEAEQHLAREWPGAHVALRSSLIYGPEPPLARVGRPLFVQFVQQALAQGVPTSFFTDEYRSAVFVRDIVVTVQHILRRLADNRRAAAAAPGGSGGLPASAAAASGGGGPDGPCSLAGLPHSVYNMGGPERISRHDMAAAVAGHCGLGTAAIKPSRSADVQRGYTSPLDISMRMDRLLQDMPDVRLTPFAEGLAQVFPR